MQNPLLRLQKYQPKSNDPQENRATEALAACLTFSVPIRQLFLDFIFEGHTLGDGASSFEVSPQCPTEDHNWIDLLISKEGACNIAIEVKVKQNEDGEQIKKYLAWLRRAKGGKPFVFHLIKHHEPTFDIRKFGGAGYRTWRDWHERLQKFAKNEPGNTDASLANYLCSYLETEGIVSIWQPTDIFPYEVGVKAKEALGNLFDQLTSKFRDGDSAGRYSTYWDWDTRGGGRPYFMVGLSSWSSIFGTGTDIRRALALYETKCGSTSDRLTEAINYEIALWWPESQKGDWDYTRVRAKNWCEFLSREGFDIEVYGRQWKLMGVPNFNFQDAPKYIVATNKRKSINRGTMAKMNSEELIDAIYSSLVDHCGLVSKLG